MPLVASSTDGRRRRIEVISELAAPPEQVWELWASPDRLARWWGPPGHPMVVEHHDLREGGSVRFHVRLPGGTRIHARFEVLSASPPSTLLVTFHTEDLEPAMVDVGIAPVGDDRSRMTIAIGFPSDEAMQDAVDIGFDRGVGLAAERQDGALG